MAPFLSVKEAAQLTGKSPSSIRRIIYPIIHDDAHADRKHVQPTVEDVLQLRVQGENFAWRLSEELLRREVPVEAASENANGGPSARLAAHADADLLAMLRRELDIKNQQITQQGQLIGKQIELISGLSERLREGNILIGSLQQRLALTDGRVSTSPPAEPVKSKRAASPQPEKGSTIARKPAKAKRSFLARIFR
jgi:hypothetical protein